MKKSVLIFVAAILLVAMLGSLFFAGAIYDAENKADIDTFFFEPGISPDQRIEMPVDAENIPVNRLRQMLISRFVNEYFYVIPVVENATARSNLAGADSKSVSPLVGLSAPNVTKKWQQTVAPDIVKMTEDKMLRFVDVRKISEAESGHLTVEYELRTWTRPNDVLAKPEIEKGTMYIELKDQPLKVDNSQETVQNLQEGYDPASAFKFFILSVERD